VYRYVFKARRAGDATKIDDYLLTWLEAFLVDRKARGMAKGTISNYINKLKKFSNYCQ